jgi:PAS domain S-box-containing protein
MGRRVAALRLKSLGDYLRVLRKDSTELQSLLSGLLVQITGFFRDRFVFEALKRNHLRKLLNEEERTSLRIWVPACSTGEEVYSLAMLCSELLSKRKSRIKVQIFGTDINESVLQKARAGIYDESLPKHVSVERRNAFFERVEGGAFRVRKNIRDLCCFGKHNLTTDPAFSNIDLISCRNLLIYLTPPLQQRLMRLFYFALRGEGLLMLGTSEATGPSVDFFTLKDKRAKIFAKKIQTDQPVARAKTGRSTSRMDLVPTSRGFDLLKVKGALTAQKPAWEALVDKTIKEHVAAGEVKNTVTLKLPESSEKVCLVFVDANSRRQGARGKPASPRASSKDDKSSLHKELGLAHRSLKALAEQSAAANEELQSTNEELETAKQELQSTNEELAALNKELEERNQELERASAISRQHAAIVESSDDAIISKSLDSTIQTWNKGAERIFGYTAAEIVGKSITLLIPEDHYDEEPTILGRLRQGQKIDHYETVRRRKDGKLINVSLTVSPIKNAAGVIVGASKIARDITEKKRIEKELEHSREEAERANRSKDEFLAALSHELRTPLNPVLLLASDAAGDSALPAEVRANFDMIRRNIEVEARLIDDLLDLTRVSSGKLKLERRGVDVHEILDSVLRMVRGDIEHKQLILSRKFDSRPAVVFGDPVRLQQVFWNVLKNAIKFTSANGIITAETQVSDKEFKLVLSDTGIGMTQQELARAFDAFRYGNSEEAQRFGGLGLGLTIGRRLVELHHGTISASSAGRNYGSTFTITLPLTESKLASNRDTPKTAPDLATLPPWRVLLVEDHNPTRAALHALLARRHLKVKSASSVSEALAVAALEEFDVVISDIGLPDGNGNDLFMNLRKRSPHLKGIALTGFGMEEDVARNQEVGFVTHLTKPVSIQALEGALRRLLQEHAILGSPERPKPS